MRDLTTHAGGLVLLLRLLLLLLLLSLFDMLLVGPDHVTTRAVSCSESQHTLHCQVAEGINEHWHSCCAHRARAEKQCNKPSQAPHTDSAEKQLNPECTKRNTLAV